MLSIKLPTITETVALNGVPVDIHPLPLFFLENVSRAYPQPDKEEDPTGYGLWVRHWTALRIIEALGLSGEVAYMLDDSTTQEGRPNWDDSDCWPAYASACEDALSGAGFTTTHANAISKAIATLDGRHLDALEPVGNS